MDTTFYAQKANWEQRGSRYGRAGGPMTCLAAGDVTGNQRLDPSGQSQIHAVKAIAQLKRRSLGLCQYTNSTVAIKIN
jgi:hypothetical protein